MTRYNVYIMIEETGNQRNPERDVSVWDCKNISTKEVMNILDLTHKKWVNRVDELKTKRR